MTYRLQDVFTAIADPNRRSILDLLSENELPVNSIVEQFKMTRPAVSKHLKVLYQCNLVYTRQVGRQRFYGLNAAPLKEVNRWTARYEKFWDKKLFGLKKHVEESR